MLNLKSLFRIAALGLAAVILAGCQQKTDSANVIAVGTIAGPETQLMEVAKQVAEKKYGLDIKIVPFTDYSMPNEALANGSLDANVFQHAPYLQQAMQQRGYKLVAVGKTFVYPMGIYSKKIKNINDIPHGAVVGIPNDPSNEARALLLLQKYALIDLKPGVGTNAVPGDVVKNPKGLVFKELDASQLPRSLPDLDLAAINTNYAMLANLLPSRDALLLEDPTSPYANLIVVRQGSEKDSRVEKLVTSLHSPEVMKEADKLFKSQAIAAW